MTNPLYDRLFGAHAGNGATFLKLADGSGWLFSHTRSGTFCTRVGWQNWCDGRPTNEAFEYGNSWQRTYDL